MCLHFGPLCIYVTTESVLDGFGFCNCNNLRSLVLKLELQLNETRKAFIS